ncbi:hypothetical protein EWM64_g8066 [Hericium alpestre]|uniref:GED domain-containing protein n=1 Tax=Hericium alpestre TaxID=135208 RepID=A0A4Y9ZM56_9AGAM|nr:hypothetical protein EWM64_g8066 [Hericium alpestre]
MKPTSSKAAPTSEQPTQLSASKYAESRKALLQLVQKLRAIGAQAVVDVPRIVVIGGQSAGKSSVVEAVSGGLNVPRDAGTCTRCPMECRMASSDKPWSCQISIRWEYEADHKKKRDVTEVPFGELTTNPKKVELMLRRAQAAVLNPHIESHRFLNMSAEQLKKGVASNVKPLAFSKNVVCIDLQGPNLVDLSFIDLPGLIQVADDPTLPQLVEQLVVDHIKGNSLILVTVPMTDDLDNQRALTLAREADPEGKRTIGVITKADVVGSGSKSRNLYLDVVEGRTKTLLHGYYCTISPDDKDREKGVTHAQARQAEANYFESNEPWSTSMNKHRFGIKNLLATLSPLLEKVIRDRLPTLRDQTTKHLKECDINLSNLPEEISAEPAAYTLGILTAFCDDIAQYVGGNRGHEMLIQANRKEYTSFKAAIRSTAPNFRPYPRNETRHQGDQSDDDDDDDDGSDDEEIAELASKPVYLDGMKKHIEKSITRELPNNVPFMAKVVLIDRFQETWAAAATVCFDEVRQEMVDILLDCVANRFGRWDQLHAQVRLVVPLLIMIVKTQFLFVRRAWVDALVDRHQTNCQLFIDAALQAEHTPYTQNTHYLQSCNDKWLARYKDRRAKGPPRAAPEVPLPSASSENLAVPEARWPFDKPAAPSPRPLAPASPDYVGEALACLAKAGYRGLVAEDLGRLRKPDEYETELQVMAEVRAFFQVSYKRIIDCVPMHIDNKFVKGILQDLHPFLVNKMGLVGRGATERCARYLAEDPDVVAQREEVVARKKTLQNVKKELDSFGISL